MSEYLPQTVREELARGSLQPRPKPSRARVVTDGQEYPVLRHWARGFAVDMNAVPPLRGLVDLYDGQRFLCKALVFATSETESERSYEFKFANRAGSAGPPADFAHDPVWDA